MESVSRPMGVCSDSINAISMPDEAIAAGQFGAIDIMAVP
jgi:hypothetical protein